MDHVINAGKMNSIFSNAQHFAVYVCCMPSHHLQWLNAPLTLPNCIRDTLVLPSRVTAMVKMITSHVKYREPLCHFYHFSDPLLSCRCMWIVDSGVGLDYVNTYCSVFTC